MKIEININGEMSKEFLIRLGKFVMSEYKGKKEHINFFVLKGLEDLKINEVLEMHKEIFGEDL